MFIYSYRVFHGIRFKVNNEDWQSVKMAFFYIDLCLHNAQEEYFPLFYSHNKLMFNKTEKDVTCLHP